MTWLRLAPFAVVLLGASAGGCGGDPNAVDLVISFETPELKRLSTVVRLSVLADGCGGTDEIYAADVAVAGTSMPAQPDTFPKGSYGFRAEARDSFCNVVAVTCVDVPLPIDGERLEIVLYEGTGSGSACVGLEMCVSGRCITIQPDGGPDTGPVSCMGEGMACGGGAGSCHGGSCCFGCWDGTVCQPGGAPRACGIGGETCAACDPGDPCTGGICEDASATGQFYLTAKGSGMRTSMGLYYSVGDNGHMQQPTPRDMTNAQTFSQYTGTLRFVDIAGTQIASAGITPEGHLYTWGENLLGALGRGATPDLVSSTPERLVIIGDELYTDVSGGDYHFCAIRDEGSLWCWGDNRRGQLGSGSSLMSSNRPVQVTPGSIWSRVAPAESQHTCAIRSDATLWCWGNNDSAQLARPATTATANAPVQIDGQWLTAAAGVYHTCGVKLDGTLWCWGAMPIAPAVENAAQLGLGDRDGRETPTQVGTRVGWRAVTAGLNHTCGILRLTDGSVSALCWGLGIWGQLGQGSQGDELMPTTVMGGTGWESIAAGWSHTCGVRAGRFYCWGSDCDARLGDGAMCPPETMGCGMMAMCSVTVPTEVVTNPP